MVGDVSLADVPASTASCRLAGEVAGAGAEPGVTVAANASIDDDATVFVPRRRGPSAAQVRRDGFQDVQQRT